jgi:hypothetical protein
MRRGETALTSDPLQYQPSTKPIDQEPRGYPFLSKENEALLRTTLVDARVELGEYDDLILRWIAKGEFGTVAVAYRRFRRGFDHPISIGVASLRVGRRVVDDVVGRIR